MAESYEEHRWVPIAESGDRWEPRSLEAALDARDKYPAGGCYSDGARWDGVASIVHEVRSVTPWTAADASTDPRDLTDPNPRS